MEGIGGLEASGCGGIALPEGKGFIYHLGGKGADKMGSRNKKRAIKLHTHLSGFITYVMNGEKANRALHRTLSSLRIDDRSRSRIAISCYSYLRWHHIFVREVQSRDPSEISMAASMVFLKEIPKDSYIPWERRKRIKALVEGSRLLQSIPEIKRIEDIDEKVSFASAPDHISERLVRSLGKKRAHGVLADSLLHPRYIGIRANTLLTIREKVMGSLSKVVNSPVPTDLDPDAFLLPDGTRIDSLEEFRQGLIEVQDLSSQIACRIALAGIEGLKVVDACAGNGGKTLALSAMMENKGMLISMDTNDRSLQRLRQRGRRAQIWNYQRLHVEDPGSLKPYEQWADLVMVDAPCSGLGTMRRNPDIKIHLSAEQLKEFPSIQLELLDTYSRLVSKNGRLAYCTCTLNFAENEGVVKEFLDRHPDFGAIPCRDLATELSSDLFRGDHFDPMPTDHHSGFFMALMQKGS